MAGIRDGPPGEAEMTRGSAGQGPAAACGTAALAPALSVSQASAGQVRLAAAVTTSEPTEPCPASRHSAGVAAADKLVPRSPGMPMRITGRAGLASEATPAWWPGAAARAGP